MSIGYNIRLTAYFFTGMESEIHSSLRTIEWKNNNTVIMIDQTKLPNKLEYVKYKDYKKVAEAIKDLVIRGATSYWS